MVLWIKAIIDFMKTFRLHASSALLFIYLLYCGISGPAAASEYSQPGFYDVDHYVLNNGMRVILKPRHIARNVAIELHVNIGHLNFPCGKRETAHFLEHLLFTGTSKHSETELDNAIESHGGTWNAQTGNEYTLYSIEIFSKHLDIALNTLHEILTDSTIDEENVEKSRKIVYREDGGKPSRIREWLFTNNIIQTTFVRGMNALFPGIEYSCSGLDENARINREDILAAYRNYYVPANMTLAVVGDFKPEYARQLIQESFGAMPSLGLNGVKKRPVPEKLIASDEIIEGRFHPLVASEASIFFAYRAGGLYSPHYYALSVLEKNFQTELYNRLRVEQGAAYYPYAYNIMHDDYGAFILETDSELDDVEKNIASIKAAIEHFKKGNLDEERLQSVKRKILLNSARGYESNASFAEYYALTHEDLKRFGQYVNYEVEIEKVTIDDIKTAADIYFNDNNLVIGVVRPTFTYTGFYLLLMCATIIVLYVIWRGIVRIRNVRDREA